MKSTLAISDRHLPSPLEWESKAFGELTKPSTERIKSGSITSSSFVVELENMDQGSGRLVRSQRLSEVRSDKTVFYSGDVLFGKLRPYLKKFWLADREGFCSTEIWVFRPISTGVRGTFLRYIIESESFLRSAFLSFGTHMPRADWKVLRESVVLLPTVEEQERIVSVLSDLEALINQIDKLIAKKKDIKQGAMQQLLTGKTRLSGFSGEWSQVALGDPSVATLTSGGTPSTAVPAFWNGDNHWVTPTDITATKSKYLTSTARKISDEGLASSSAQMLPVGTVLLCSRATVGEVRISKIPVCTNQGFKAIVAAPGTSNEFLYYKLLTMKERLLERSFGSTFLELPMREAKAVPFRIPTFEEQHAIAQILSEMDAEIDALVAQREKTALIKTGMMQELLTGRTRLL